MRCGSFSPPLTDTVPDVFVTNPVWLFPKINSLKKTKAWSDVIADRSYRVSEG